MTQSSPDMPLWARLRDRRRELGMNATQAGAECGVSQAAYSRWEGGRAPDEAHVDDIAKFLGIARRDVVLLRAGERLDAVAGTNADTQAELAEVKARLDWIEATLRRPGQGSG